MDRPPAETDDRRSRAGSDDLVRVLHVEDHDSFADLTSTLLERESDRIVVESVSNVREGLDRLREGRVDCIVSDYDMPGQNGVEFLQTVREDHEDLPFVLFTGKGSEEIASDAISAGVTDYLQKGGGIDQYAILANRIENLAERYRSQRALAANRKRLSLFIDQSPLGVIEWSLDFDLVRMNPAAEEILGYDAEEVRGWNWREFVPEDDYDDVDSVLAQLQADEGGYHHVNENVTKDGETIRCEWHNRVITGDDGEVVAVFSQFQDVTEREERRAELETERRFVEQALNVIDDVFYVIGPDGTFERVNDRACEVSGYAEAELMTMEPMDFFRPADRDRVARDTRRAFETGRAEIEADLVTREGEVIPYEFRKHRLVDADGTVTGVAGIGRDIAERKAHERAVTALHEVATDLDASASVDDICQRTVDAAEKVLQFDLSVIAIEEDGLLRIRAESTELPPDASTPMSVDEGIAGKTYRTGESFLIDDIREHEEGNPQGPYRSFISVPVGDHGNFQAVSESVGAFDEDDLELAELLVGRTASTLDRLERERELQRQNERLEEFASLVSHDLQTPLTVASGRLELARESRDSEHLREVAHAHDRMADLTGDLLTLAQADRRVTDPDVVDVAATARACWRSVDTADATLSVETERFVRGDEHGVKRLLENLLRNSVEHGSTSSQSTTDDAVEHGSTSSRPESDDAVEHSSASGRPEADDGGDGDDGVHVTVGDVEGGFYVADDGPGIPADRRESVFERGHSSAEDGSGLGLFIVGQIAEAHGWDVELATSDDGGARFEFTSVDVE